MAEGFDIGDFFTWNKIEKYLIPYCDSSNKVVPNHFKLRPSEEILDLFEERGFFDIPVAHNYCCFLVPFAPISENNFLPMVASYISLEDFKCMIDADYFIIIHNPNKSMRLVENETGLFFLHSTEEDWVFKRVNRGEFMEYHNSYIIDFQEDFVEGLREYTKEKNMKEINEVFFVDK